IGIIHAERNTTALELVYFIFDHLPVFTLKFYGKLSFTRHHKISGAILVAKSMTAYNDRAIPCCNQSRYVFYYDRFTKNSSIQDIPDSSVGALPHLLQV